MSVQTPPSDPDETSFIQRMFSQRRAPNNPIPDCLLTVETRAAWVRQNPISNLSEEARNQLLWESVVVMRSRLEAFDRKQRNKSRANTARRMAKRRAAKRQRGEVVAS